MWTRKANLESTSVPEKASLLREIAGLWADRFGNYAQAVKPLEALLVIVPDDREAMTRLKEIYTRRRQWRALRSVPEPGVLAMRKRFGYQNGGKKGQLPASGSRSSVGPEAAEIRPEAFGEEAEPARVVVKTGPC